MRDFHSLVNNKPTIGLPDKAQAEEWDIIVQDGQRATEAEHSQTIIGALQTQWKGIAWACVLSLSIAMYGYDNSLIANYYGYPAFQKAYALE